MEETFVIGQGWSGWLRYYEQRPQDFPFVLHHIARNGQEDINLFRSVEDVEQYMDGLDEEFDDFPMDADNDYAFYVEGGMPVWFPSGSQ